MGSQSLNYLNTYAQNTKTKNPNRKKPNNHESKLQIACVTWFKLQYPDVVIYSIPNGGTRHQKEVKKIKDEGVLAGVPDLFIMKSNRGFHGLYIEMKYGSNKPSEAQLNFMRKAREEKYATIVCYTFESFVSVCNDYLKDYQKK